MKSAILFAVTAGLVGIFSAPSHAVDNQGRKPPEGMSTRAKENKPAQTGAARVQDRTQTRASNTLSPGQAAGSARPKATPPKPAPSGTQRVTAQTTARANAALAASKAAALRAKATAPAKPVTKKK